MCQYPRCSKSKKRIHKQLRHFTTMNRGFMAIIYTNLLAIVQKDFAGFGFIAHTPLLMASSTHSD